MCSVLLIQKTSTFGKKHPSSYRQLPGIIVLVQFKIKSAFARLYRNNDFGKGKKVRRMGIITSPCRVGIAEREVV